MKHVMLTILCAVFLAGCAASTALTPYDHAVADGYIVQCPKQVPGEPWKSCQPPPFRPSMNLGQVVTDLATIPLRLPEAMIDSYPSGRRVYCRSYTYRDEYHTTCY